LSWARTHAAILAAACGALLCANAAAPTPALAKDGPAPKAKAEPGTLLVKFEQASGTKAKVEALGDTQAAKTANGVSVVRIQPGETVAAKVREYDRRPDVQYAEPNYIASADLASPNDPYFSSLWALSAIDAVAGWAIYPGQYTPFGGVVVAVDDTGIDYAHEDLGNGQVLIASGATCTSGSCVPSAARDDQYHGTHVAGTIGASANNGLGVTGLAYNSTLLPVKVLDSSGSGSYASVASGIYWSVAHGARVVNLSLGGTGYSTTLCDAVSSAVGAGTVVVAAAGNSSSNAPSYPAACPGAIGVAATDIDGSSASFSNWGSPNVFVSAPGVGIYSTVPDSEARPSSSYASLSGTSMAAPQVSGLAELLVSQDPLRTVAEVKRILALTSNKIGATLYPGLSYGADPYGICSCTWHPYYGYGQIDVHQALHVIDTWPNITLVSSLTGYVGDAVTITGWNFTGVTAVTLGSVNATYTVNSPTQITANVPAGTAYPQQRWRVTNANGTGVYDPLFTILRSSPVITSISSMSGHFGDAVTITGSNFAGVTAVTLGGVSATFTADSGTQITAHVPAGTPYDQQRWRVTNADGTGVYDPLFTILHEMPTITGVLPMSGHVGDAVTITGSNFTGATAVTLGGVNATYTVNSPTQITANVPAGTLYDQQRWRVTNADGTGVYDPLFTILHNSPLLTNISPLSGHVGDAVTITGANFTGVTAVTLGGVSATYTVNSPTQITANVPAGTLYDQQRWRVTNADGTGVYDPLFTIVHGSVPVLTNVSPMSGVIGSAVTITGANFTGATAVTLGGVSATYAVDSPTQITATVPAGTPYAQQRWRVTNADGTGVYDPLFTITNWTGMAVAAAFEHRG